jgi:hypothetical protein
MDGITCTVELPFGFKFKGTYAVVGRDQLPEEHIGNDDKEEAASNSSLLSLTTSPPDHQSCIRDEMLK